MSRPQNLVQPPPPVESLERRLLLHAPQFHGSSDVAELRHTPLSMSPAAAAAGAQLLPDLVALADEARGYVHGWSMDGGSSPGRALLRLTTAVANVGSGPLELRGGESRPDGTQEVFQRVYDGGGGSTDHLAGSFTHHPDHGHIHFDDFTRYSIREIRPGGRVGDVLGSGQKVSFCLIDQYAHASLPGSPAAAVYVDCSDGSRQGISVGWADVYQKGLPDQWVDVTDIPAGRYWLEVVVDPDDRITESDESNNAVRIEVQIDPAGAVLRPDRFEPNDTFDAARELATAAGRSENFLSVHSTSDEDYFRFVSSFTGTVVVDTWPDAPGLGDVNLSLYGSDHALLAESAGPTPQERVSAAVTAGQSYYLRVSAGSGATNPSYTLHVHPPPPTISVTASDPSATEAGGDTGAFTVSRGSKANSPLTVRYAVAGTATNGRDYLELGGSVVIPPFESSVTVHIEPIDDPAREADETLTFTLQEDLFYTIDSAAVGASLSIADDEPPQPLPAPWAAADVGAVAVPGAAEVFSDGTIALTGAGAATTTNGREDAFHGAYQPLTGDGGVVTRIVSWDRQTPGAEVGVTLREGHAAGARAISLKVRSDGSIALLIRRGPGKSAKAVPVGSVAAGPSWLRLSRSGRLVTPATSSDGAAWQTLPVLKAKLGDVLYAGLTVGAGDGAGLATASFADSAVMTLPAAPRNLLATIAPGQVAPGQVAPGQVALSWTHDGADETGFVVERSGKKARGYSAVGLLSADVSSFTHVADDFLQRRRYYYRVVAVNGMGSSVPSNTAVVRT
ncbi:MAG TPA: lysyl oxidase family protein [Tepidisphaeraceae bacterium]|nr:lysyl oxidase family protein [Tepidisphaeraceae bacterium]